MKRYAVRDGRPGFYMIQNSILDEYGARMGPFGIALYNALCRFAGQDNTAYPSLRRLAEVTGMSRRAVVKHMQTLVDLGLISAEKRQTDAGDADTNLYTIVNPANGVVHDMHHVVHDMHQGGAPNAPGVVHEVHTNNTQRKKTQLTTQRDGDGREASPEEQQDVCVYWRDNMQIKLTPIICNDLRGLIGAYGVAEVKDAIAIAVRNDKRSLSYVRGILERRANGTQTNGYNGVTLIPEDEE